ncbi:hypothetical protein CNQ87_10725 [Lysinibacillus fusiformis]|uniref:hemoblobin-interacting domain-containing protein n=1 Tax=Lysinibacillus fusiformis TaxID=28031 RepID=UPI000BBB4392|nr:hypothetical protein [Lysinibacillus fusiformis]PCD84804.1 hypothetical protein CNQ87_10725 [Lysinibacillus fusiformis]
MSLATSSVEPEILTPPTYTAITNVTGAIPHISINTYDVNYEQAITEVILQRESDTPVSYKVTNGDFTVQNSNIALFVHGTYSITGKYIWTIKATGYTDATVSVDVK